MWKNMNVELYNLKYLAERRASIVMLSSSSKEGEPRYNPRLLVRSCRSEFTPKSILERGIENVKKIKENVFDYLR
jgi:hypothetical protein